MAAFLQDEVVQEVRHAQWVFTVHKMLRVYFLHHREFLVSLSRAAYETVKELMAAAAVEEKGSFYLAHHGIRPATSSIRIRAFTTEASPAQAVDWTRVHRWE